MGASYAARGPELDPSLQAAYVKVRGWPPTGPDIPPVPMPDPQELLKIGDFAQLAGTNLRTLRYYEELELLAPALRSEGGFRYYRPTDVHRVRMIHDLQELGLNLERIRELVDTRREVADRQSWVRRVQVALAEQRALIEDRVAALEVQKQRLVEAQQKLDHCAHCEHRPTPDNNHCEPCQQTGGTLPESLSALF